MALARKAARKRLTGLCRNDGKRDRHVVAIGEVAPYLVDLRRVAETVEHDGAAFRREGVGYAKTDTAG